MHCRSIFLQGLLLKNKNELPKKFIEYSKTWDSYHEWLRDNNLSPEEACINFILKKKEISKIIIGIDNLEQLKKILITRQKSNYSLFANNNIDQKLIDPRKW
jgi:aryl-alcohol dehydrogenase-like predicted oxidoreductase